MMLTRDDGDFIQRALELAGRGEGHTRPNPPVGAVVVKNGKIIGEGWHRRCGGDHAEVAAIKDARRNLKTSKSQSLEACTLYVTLEPCSKPGRVGACTDAIIAAGVKRVVYLVSDPNPKNRGKAKRALAKHGIDCVKVCRRTCEEKAWDYCLGLKPLVECGSRMIAPFAKHVTTGLPFVTVKLAMSLDGKICDDRGNARWISNADSRKCAGWERARVDAIMVGAETVRRDNPSLLSHNKRNDDLIRVVVTRSGKLPKNAQVFTDGAPNETKVFRVGRAAKGAAVPVGTDPKGPVDAKDLKDVLRQLGKMGVMHVFCEGGLTLARSLADAGLVDAWISFLAPIVIGSNPLKNALRFHQYSGGGCGDDMESRYELPCWRLRRHR
jgi:diaminohydroxyphosphoribosylaminopyrimidine deaminase/5-amino-6-(5-phosphoribosylamino)uracil reductase